MQVYLIRHTSPEIEKGICYGQSDILLNLNVFDAEVEKISSILPKDIEHIYSSPLKRCSLLAEKLSENVSLHPDLMELNFGNWEMQKWTDLTSEKFTAWMEDFVHVKTENGESYADLYFRTQRFLDFLLKQNHKKVALVCHAGNIRSIMSYLLDLPLANSFRFHLNYASVVEIKLFGNKTFNKLISIEN